MSWIRVILTVLIFNGISAFSQQEGSKDFDQKNYSSKQDISAEYLVPTRFNNQIKTASMHFLFWKKRFVKNYIMLSAGVSCTYAWGYSEQFKLISDSVAEIDIYKTSGFGIGPVIQIEPALIKIDRFALTGEASGGILFYNNKFPYGGDHYNFMFRIGPSISYRTYKNYYLKIGYRWMHVSNGKGYGNQNPFYEAQGINIGVTKIW